MKTSHSTNTYWTFTRLAYSIFIVLCFIVSCKESNPSIKSSSNSGVQLFVLGNVQDGGSPHIGCMKKCCALLHSKPDGGRKVVSLGLVDVSDKKTFLFEATPDISSQISLLEAQSPAPPKKAPDGIFITHAHIGHYTGLMYLGREALGSKNIPVYVMPRMQSFLESNGPWDQLVKLSNIQLNPLKVNQSIRITQQIQVIPFVVPHRDEYSETVGYRIEGPKKSVLFIPDINKWHLWNENIIEAIALVDYAFLDATFYDQSEIPHRNMSEIPHPFVEESLKLFESLENREKEKIYFIHLNHSNPLLDQGSDQSKYVLNSGFNIARLGQKFEL